MAPAHFRLPEGEIPRLLAAAFPRFFAPTGAIPVEPVPGGVARGYRLARGPTGIRIEYAETADFMRALGSLVADPGLDAETAEPAMDFRGFMLDASRNGVPRVDVLKTTLLRLALLGYTHCCLYTEDTYEVAGHPLVGYRRGKFLKDEIRGLDAFAGRLGITMFPCIQTLGHLEQVLKHDRYRELGDNDAVLATTSAAARALVETLLREASEPYASRIVHVGMDETWGIGRGSTFMPDTPVDPRRMYLDHVRFVADACRRLGLSPMMWGDIIVGHRDRGLDAAQRAAFPRDMEVVFWDYYAEDPGAYAGRIAEYRAMGREPICAPGIWNWGTLWPSHRTVGRTLPVFAAEARKAGIRRMLLTAWGDDGQECPLGANWPALALFAEETYAGGGTTDGGKRRMEAVTGLAYDALVGIGDIDLLPGREGLCGTLGKLLLWEDPLSGRCSHHLGDLRLGRRYAELASFIATARGKAPREWRDLFAYAESLARVLALKAELYRDARAAYMARGASALGSISRRVARLIPLVRGLWKSRRAVWFAEFKPAGWEVLEQRFGGLVARLETMKERLDAFRSGRLAAIEELDEEPVREFESLAGMRAPHRQLFTVSTVS